MAPASSAVPTLPASVSADDGVSAPVSVSLKSFAEPTLVESAPSIEVAKSAKHCRAKPPASTPLCPS
eukprot:scaffold18342_cov63-Phaeocystis_antarctica.AAC.4